MIIIRELRDIDMRQAIELKALCWPEELGGLSNNKINIDKEIKFWSSWMHEGVENNDVRVLLGAFENEKLLGVTFASFAEIDDILEHGIELNGLWVYPEHRNKGVSLMLVNRLLSYYKNLGMKQVVIYNLHYSSSNSYYRKYGATVMRIDNQLEEKLPVDVFICNIDEMNKNIMKVLNKYNII